ncbi:hypothetical protein FACS1894180_1290 [Bacteroidia bacterium]|nr:hypothetical protein FACS1894180_1290 [Bacteroidia bacterium]
MIECYLLTRKDKKEYSEIWVKNNTSIKFEDYLKIRLVEDYLNKNKDLLKQKTSALNNIDFAYETNKEYIDSHDNKIKLDKIDIYVNKLGLQKEWQGHSDPYFAIECKRIKKLADTANYISDIQNFCNRNYIKTRLLFEGQIAFIENAEITHSQLSKKINEKLPIEVITENPLNAVFISDKYDGTYLSKHKRKNQLSFSIYHLLLDYSEIVVN